MHCLNSSIENYGKKEYKLTEKNDFQIKIKKQIKITKIELFVLF